MTAAQALHWFRLEPFFAEAERVLRPGGVLAVWCYGLARIDPAVDAIVRHLYADILGAYWEPERRLVEDGYRGIALPFSALAPPPFEMQLEWTLPDLLGYLRTWSALRAFVRQQGTDPLAPLEPALARAWGGAAAGAAKAARWTLSVQAARR
jgi:SAM-dependent methyltransferase